LDYYRILVTRGTGGRASTDVALIDTDHILYNSGGGAYQFTLLKGQGLRYLLNTKRLNSYTEVVRVAGEIGDGRVSGKQEDTLQNLVGGFRVPTRNSNDNANNPEYNTDASGVFSGGVLEGTSYEHHKHSGMRVLFDASLMARASDETRPKNRLMIIWRRTA
jgi:hypothetical protein